jgi:hypothetical protein
LAGADAPAVGKFMNTAFLIVGLLAGLRALFLSLTMADRQSIFALMELKAKLQVIDLTRFLHASRNPTRSKTL